MGNRVALLRGRKWHAIMVMYWQGRITAMEAGELIGVSWRQIARASPTGFAWDVARAKHVRKIGAARLRYVDEE